MFNSPLHPRPKVGLYLVVAFPGDVRGGVKSVYSQPSGKNIHQNPKYYDAVEPFDGLSPVAVCSSLFHVLRTLAQVVREVTIALIY